MARRRDLTNQKLQSFLAASVKVTRAEAQQARENRSDILKIQLGESQDKEERKNIRETIKMIEELDDEGFRNQLMREEINAVMTQWIDGLNQTLKLEVLLKDLS